MLFVEDVQNTNAIVIGSMSDAINFMEGEADTFYEQYKQSLRVYLSDYIEKYEKAIPLNKNDNQVSKPDITFTDEFMQNKEKVTGLKAIFPVYKNMEIIPVDEMTPSQEMDYDKFSRLQKSTVCAINNADALKNEKNRVEKHLVFPLSSAVIGLGAATDLLVNKADALISKVSDVIGFDMDAHNAGFILGAGIVAVAVASGYGISKAVSKIAYSNKIKEAEEDRYTLSGLWEENKNAHMALSLMSKRIDEQHAENQEILETKARAELLQNAFYQSPHALKYGLNG